MLGGRGMIIVYEEKELRRYMNEAVEASEERPVLIDRFLENAVEIDVDVIADRGARRHRSHHAACGTGGASIQGIPPA